MTDPRQLTILALPPLPGDAHGVHSSFIHSFIACHSTTTITTSITIVLPSPFFLVRPPYHVPLGIDGRVSSYVRWPRPGDAFCPFQDLYECLTLGDRHGERRPIPSHRLYRSSTRALDDAAQHGAAEGKDETSSAVVQPVSSSQSQGKFRSPLLSEQRQAMLNRRQQKKSAIEFNHARRAPYIRSQRFVIMISPSRSGNPFFRRRP